MTFTIVLRDVPPLVVEARSWYECRDWARAEFGDAVRTIEAGGSNPTHIVENTKTCTELAHEHGESLREAGRREAYADIYHALRDPKFTVPDVVRQCAWRAGIEEVENNAEAAE